jgi:hypothetical protein
VVAVTEQRTFTATLSACAAFVSAAATLFILLAWTRRLSTTLLIVAGATLALAVLAAWRQRTLLSGSKLLLASCAVLAFTLVAGILADRRFARIEFDWNAVVAEREAHLSARLAERMADVTRTGLLAAERAAEVPDTTRVAAFAWLDALRNDMGVDALVLFDEVGGLVAWAGDHRGSIPEVVRRGIARPYYAERPLYSYLYFTAPV